MSMIAKRRGYDRVELYITVNFSKEVTPVALLHIDEFEDLFGKEIADKVKQSNDVEIETRLA